ncbi:MAG: hypothetical protein ABS96_23960 [Lysobacteraceae bacterium SCN 69-123]|nr:MAG: hypothetical protein ABS96_23960 [Xanthomonadaceae bacterium SCN 69-123]
MGDPATLRPVDLLQDRVGAQPAPAFIRIEERVDRRQAQRGDVGDGHRQQPATPAGGTRGADLEEAPMRPAADQELVELVRAMVVHAALGMACGQVAPVQRELLVGACGRQHPAIEVLVARQAAALAAVGCEAVHRHPHRHAGPALLAVRAVDQVAGAAEAPAQCHRVELAEAAVLRVEHQVARAPLREIAAGVLAGLEQAQFFVGVAMQGHDHSIAAGGLNTCVRQHCMNGDGLSAP